MFLVLAALLVSTGAIPTREKRQAPFPVVPDECAGQPFQRDPNNCRNFFLTCNGETFEGYCLSDTTFFDEQAQLCQWHDQGGEQVCGPVARTGGWKDTACLDNPEPGRAQHVADPTNCQRYLVCNSRNPTATTQDCAAGTLFNITGPGNFGTCAIIDPDLCRASGRNLDPEVEQSQREYLGSLQEVTNQQQGGFGQQQGGFGQQQGGGFGRPQGGFGQQQQGGGGGFGQQGGGFGQPQNGFGQGQQQQQQGGFRPY